jgi:ABC-type transporter Mla subunit MlaD
MEERRGFGFFFATGLFSIAALIAVAATLGFLYSKEAPIRETFPLRVRFADVSGLRLGAPVMLQGAHIGRVASLRLADPEPPRFKTSGWEVELAIRADDADIRRKLTTTSVFTIQPESVFGNKYVNASFGDGGAALEPRAVIEGAVGAGIDARTFEKLSSALENLSGAAAELRGLIAEDAASGRPNIRNSLAKLDSTLANAAEASAILKEALSIENQTKMRQTFDDLSKSAANLANVTERMKAGMDSWAETIEKMKFWKGWFGGNGK